VKVYAQRGMVARDSAFLEVFSREVVAGVK